MEAFSKSPNYSEPLISSTQAAVCRNILRPVQQQAKPRRSRYALLYELGARRNRKADLSYLVRPTTWHSSPNTSAMLSFAYEILRPKDTSQLEAVLQHEHLSYFQDLDALMAPSSSTSRVARHPSLNMLRPPYQTHPTPFAVSFVLQPAHLTSLLDGNCFIQPCRTSLASLWPPLSSFF
jgi:hypothetical protein